MKEKMGNSPYIALALDSELGVCRTPLAYKIAGAYS